MDRHAAWTSTRGRTAQRETRRGASSLPLTLDALSLPSPSPLASSTLAASSSSTTSPTAARCPVVVFRKSFRATSPPSADKPTHRTGSVPSPRHATPETAPRPRPCASTAAPVQTRSPMAPPPPQCMSAPTTETTATKTTTTYRAAGTERVNLPLAQRYQPTKAESLLWEPARLKTLSRWIKRRATGYEGAERAAILMGPPGSGKTSAARVLLRAAGFQVVEFGPGSLTTEASLAKQVRRVVKRRPLPGTRPAAALIDDFDGMCALERDAEPRRRAGGNHGTNAIAGDDDDTHGGKRARVGNLVGLIAEAKATWGPIIVCSNDSGSTEVRLVRDVCLQVWVDAVSRARLLHLAKKVAGAEGHGLDDIDAARLADAACGDIRRLLNGMDVRMRVGRTLSKTSPTSLGASDVFFNNFDATEALLAGSVHGKAVDCVEASAIYRTDPLLRRAMVHHNYLHVVIENTLPDREADAVDRLAAIADNFSAADGMDFGSGATGSAGLGDRHSDGVASWRAGSGSGGGWTYGANPATAVLWACSTRALVAPMRAGTVVVPRVKFCSPSSSDRTAYAEGRLRRRAAIAVALPAQAVVGSREPLLAEFDLMRAAFVGAARTAYTTLDIRQRRAIVNRILWTGATADIVAGLLNWQRMRAAVVVGDDNDKKWLMPPPLPTLRHTVPLIADMAAHAQVCTVTTRSANMAPAMSTRTPMMSTTMGASFGTRAVDGRSHNMQGAATPTRKRKDPPTTPHVSDGKRYAPSGGPLGHLPPARVTLAPPWSGRSRGNGRGRGSGSGVGYRALSRGRGRGTANRGRW
ncbi:Holliday junction DNA helicase ruvB N-terminus incomplete domain containing protein [Pandoravirus quercus]|uniref:Holliday junction DNA helicase ruvB N-terminus incomplete domain containing protein n=1 Tax=Pandoravirus quercus TaxID=2107709 RepID=A0A2U7U8Q9_9VIRU|nr:Holliday junction DNA helicase ruvB N-terminus incomplete domain containing protein [Pandoravirus quercus]AVK74831.1 Holliday junction DNA helicase ruvB N-terminus incomplete domain containing protein [Pandoravirus quercus]